MMNSNESAEGDESQEVMKQHLVCTERGLRRAYRYY